MKETLLSVSSDEEKFVIEDPKLYDTTLVKIYCVFDRWRKTCAKFSADQFKTLVAIWFSGLSHAYDSFLDFTLTSQRKPLLRFSDTPRNALVCLLYLLHVVSNHLGNVNFPTLFKVRLCLRNAKKVLQRLDLIGNICDIVLSSFVI